jgi:hypothetical protein
MKSTSRKPSKPFTLNANELENVAVQGGDQAANNGRGSMHNQGQTVQEKVRRYRAIASLCRQTAAFRPLQRWSLLQQAEEWEHAAVKELEGYFDRSTGAVELGLWALVHTDTPSHDLVAA